MWCLKQVESCEFHSAEVGKNTEYVYYSVSSDSDSFNPLYRLDIAGRDSRGMCVHMVLFGDADVVPSSDTSDRSLSIPI